MFWDTKHISCWLYINGLLHFFEIEQLEIHEKHLAELCERAIRYFSGQMKIRVCCTGPLNLHVPK